MLWCVQDKKNEELRAEHGLNQCRINWNTFFFYGFSHLFGDGLVLIIFCFCSQHFATHIYVVRVLQVEQQNTLTNSEACLPHWYTHNIV